MALPASVPTGTVTGTWYTPKGDLAVGTIVFLLLESVEIPDDPDGVVIPVKTVVDVPAGQLNQTLPEGLYQVSVRLSELYRVTKVIEVIDGVALNLPDAVGMLLPDPDLYDPVRSVNGHFPDQYGNIFVPGGGGGGVTDHGSLTGLSDDDHPQYHNNARGDARYAGIVHNHAISDVTGLSTALDGKQPSGSYATTSELTSGLATKADTSAVTAAIAAARPKVRYERITSGNVTPLPNTSGSFALPGQPNGLPLDFVLSIPAAVGDWVEISIHGMKGDNTQSFFDAAVRVGSTAVRWMSTGTSTPAVEGDPGWYPPPFNTITSSRGFVVEAGDLDGSDVVFVLGNKSANAGTLYASATFPFYWQVKNLGQIN